MRRIPVLTCLVLTLLAGIASNAGACPTSELVVAGSSPTLSQAAENEIRVVRDGAVVALAGYDLVEGSLGAINPGALGGTSVLARDAFDVGGLAAGTPVPVRIQLVVDGAIWTDGCGGSGCWGNVEAELRAGGDFAREIASANMYAAGRRTFQFTVELPVTLVAGQPTDVEFWLKAWRPPGASHSSEGFGAYRFLGLPAGAGIVSCNGFAGLPSPAMPASWGSVKAVYR